MARLVGVDLPKNKRIEIGLTYIYGIGRTTSQKILKLAGIDLNKRTDDISEQEVAKLKDVIEQTVTVEGDLRRDISLSIKRLMDLGCHRGIRHRKGLPVRGQRTRTNSRTRKGPRKTVANKKK